MPSRISPKGRTIKNLDHLQRCHINHKAVTYIAFKHTLVSRLNVFIVNHFDIRNNVIFGTVIRQFMSNKFRE